MCVFGACSKLVVVLAAAVVAFFVTPDVLKGFSSDMKLQQWQIQAAHRYSQYLLCFRCWCVVSCAERSSTGCWLGRRRCACKKVVPVG